jgi:type I restriction enzyme R subunit
MNKKNLTEADIRTKFITPAIEAAGWDKVTQMREEYFFTAGRIIVRGKLVARGKGKKVDYLLYASGKTPIAVVEAKDNKHEVAGGMQQALGSLFVGAATGGMAGRLQTAATGISWESTALMI